MDVPYIFPIFPEFLSTLVSQKFLAIRDALDKISLFPPSFDHFFLTFIIIPPILLKVKPFGPFGIRIRTRNNASYINLNRAVIGTIIAIFDT